MSYWSIMQEIEKLPHYREYICLKCGHKQKVLALLIQHNCENCSERYKMRSYGSIGTEVEDVIDCVLDWMGEGEVLEEIMKWKQVRDSFPDENDV